MDEIDAIDVRAEFLGALNLKWDQPQGKPVNLGYIRPGGDVWTDASYWQVDDALAEDYNLALAKLFGGEVRAGRKKKDGSMARWVTRRDGNPFRIEEVMDRLSGWPELMEDFQNAIVVASPGTGRVDPLRNAPQNEHTCDQLPQQLIRPPILRLGIRMGFLPREGSYSIWSTTASQRLGLLASAPETVLPWMEAGNSSQWNGPFMIAWNALFCAISLFPKFLVIASSYSLPHCTPRDLAEAESTSPPVRNWNWPGYFPESRISS